MSFTQKVYLIFHYYIVPFFKPCQKILVIGVDDK